ncbi:MAG: flagellar basal body P-ring protein FlgI [Planctomycetota bacterium]|nr:flagellar basal body P-ring protein FlgI [Planctomycetota bacterium]
MIHPRHSPPPATLRSSTASSRRLIAGMLISALGLGLATGCQDLFLEKAPKRTKEDRIDRTNFTIEVDPIMRNTVASEGILTGYQPTVVHGYGLVVGLKQTGSRLVPAEVRSMMVEEMALRGIGDPRSGWDHLTPDSMLDSEDTAVVVVEGVIPPGAPKGSSFDIRVFALPGSTTSSLEGGRLYTTDLRPGPLATGSKQAFALAKGSGPIFINPFVEPGTSQRSSINSLSGRILNGGTTTKDMPIKLRMATSSHARTATVEKAINSNFPREPGQKEKTARGESGDSIWISVPPSYSENTEEFVQLLKHTSLNVGAPEATAQAIRRGVLANPGGADAARWRWCALGPKAVPMIQDLYDHADEAPRFSALSAGARLNDALAVPHLLDVAKTARKQSRRLAAIAELGRMGTNPRIDLGLRELLNDPDVDVRLAVFDAMVKRNDPTLIEIPVSGRFTMCLVESDHDMIYIAQTGSPRVAIFGDALELKLPLTVNTWSGRLLMKGDADDEEIQVFYRSVDGEAPIIGLAPTDVPGMVRFLGHETTIREPDEGLGLQYGEVIGALHQLWSKGYISCDFKAEQDRILAAILANETEQERIRRPEFDEDATGAPFTPSRPGEDPNQIDPIPARSGLEGEGSKGDTVPR